MKAKDIKQKAHIYGSPFLNVQANDLINWFTKTIEARTKLSVLLRILVHSTGLNLQKVDFPGNDDAERHGWDGIIEANSCTPWIPSGISGWEFGVNKDIKGKADNDFAKSVQATKQNDRMNMTFIFVTPRRWPSKSDWVSKMKAKNDWKDVRVYDASDLEQWIEQSFIAQTWFMNQTERPSNGVRTLECCWTDWSNVTTPKLHPSLFDTANEKWRTRIKSFLNQENENPLVIGADSVEEALAFLSQVFATTELEQYMDQVLVFDTPGVLPRLIQGTTNFIAVVHTRDVEREVAPYSDLLKIIAVYPRNAINMESHIVLEPISSDQFEKSLKIMGKSSDDIKKLSRQSGRSLTVLRRQLSTINAIHVPEWAQDATIASELIPFVLVGVWNAQNKNDQAVLSRLAGVSIEILERRITNLLQLNDSPVWSIGEYRGVISKIDSLFAIASSISKTDLDRFYDIAREVLGEDDPALDLSVEDRWMAEIYDKKREFSTTIRKEIAETLVLLAVYGREYFGKRFGFDGESEAGKIIRDLFVPLTTRKLEANQDMFPLYAEAAPNALLTIIENDLRAKNSAVIGLLKPTNANCLVSCPRSGLLWALEGLAWNPTTFPRVVMILAKLSDVEIRDNWGNTPKRSLSSIFCAWMPQTEAKHHERLKAINMLLEKHLLVGWDICIQQLFKDTTLVGTYSYKPKWRSYGHGFGKPFDTWTPVTAFSKEIIRIVLSRPFYTVNMLCDLLSRIHLFSQEDQTRVWKIINEWRNGYVPDNEIAQLREKIRKSFLSRYGLMRIDKEEHSTLIKKAKEVYDELQPTDIVNKYEWLFHQEGIDISVEDIDGDENDFRIIDQCVKKLRSKALTDILIERGIPGILELSQKGKTQRTIGTLLVSGILSEEQVEDLILKCLSFSENNSIYDGIIAGMFFGLREEERINVYSSLRSRVNENEALQLLLLSPYRASTWQLVDQLSSEARCKYWKIVVPGYIFDSPEENNNSIIRLLEAKRPQIAFEVMEYALEEVRPKLLVQILSAMINANKDKLDADDVLRAFQLLNGNSDITLEEKARLEFAYIDVLSRSNRGGDQLQIPNLEYYIQEHPEVFVEAVVALYKRDDDGKDPEQFHDMKNSKYAWLLLETIERIPGQNESTKEQQREKLEVWMTTVRRFCSELGRLDIADFRLGKLFAKAPVGEDGVWPNEVVRDVLESSQSEYIRRGVCIGLYNARGPHFRKNGGEQERELAKKYRAWADALAFTHPYVSSSILREMVDMYLDEANQQDIKTAVQNRLMH